MLLKIVIVLALSQTCFAQLGAGSSIEESDIECNDPYVICYDDITYTFCGVIVTPRENKTFISLTNYTCPENYLCNENSTEICEKDPSVTEAPSTCPTVPPQTTVTIPTTITDIPTTTTEIPTTTTEVPTTTTEVPTTTTEVPTTTTEVPTTTTEVPTTTTAVPTTTTAVPTTTTAVPTTTTTEEIPTGPPECTEEGYFKGPPNQYYECVLVWWWYEPELKNCSECPPGAGCEQFC